MGHTPCPSLLFGTSGILLVSWFVFRHDEKMSLPLSASPVLLALLLKCDWLADVCGPFPQLPYASG